MMKNVRRLLSNKYFMNLTVCLVVIMSFSSVEANEDRELEIQHLNERYKDFYIHENEKKRREVERKSAASEQRELRRQLEVKREKARKKQVLLRQGEPDQLENIAKEKEYAKKIEIREQKQEKKRRAFVEERRRLIKLRQEAKKIPDEKELGLE